MATHQTRPESGQSHAGTALGWLMTITFNAVLPFVTYSVLTGHGWHQAPALVATGVWPVVELALSYAVRRHVDEVSLLVLVFIGLGVVSMLAFNSPRLILIKDSAVTGLFGLASLASLAARRPLMFYFGRRFATDGSAEAARWWDGLWQYPSFRHIQRVTTTAWGVAFVAEALVRIGLTYLLSVRTMVLVTNVLPLVVLAAMITWTSQYAKRARRAAQQAQPGSARDPVRTDHNNR